jgi:hypothetical protein
LIAKYLQSESLIVSGAQKKKKERKEKKNKTEQLSI